ncbi:hypothetical protein [Streptomyces xantholiticus]|uniref:hypothetical protein n=1 Tax=Streptomyces xantholiticus TaxID=68285 RepID=UPI0016726708|nr:hypothetical protein [Streptomyces xantholiticus]GGW41396.1 hypothetical protein GCM10010381_27830 [Streptomyces xantholiticus]
MPDTVLAGQLITADMWNRRAPVLKNYTPITANSSNTTTVETVAITTASVTFETGRAYRVILRGLGQSSVAEDTMTMRVRKTNTSGQVLLESFRIYIPAGGVNVDYYSAQVCTNTTGADVSAALVGTYVRNTGTGNCFMAASATHVSYIQVEDIGPASDFPSAVAII